MSDQEIIDTIADAIQPGIVDGDISVLSIADRALTALHSAGCAIVKLPEPDVGAIDNGHRPRHWEWNVTPGAGDFAGTDVHAYSDGVIDVVYESNELTPDVARRLAAALLAAADKAEEGK